MSRFSALRPSVFTEPSIVLAGPVDHAMYSSFRSQLRRAPAEGVVVTVISTLGGDPEVARLIGEEIRFLSEQEADRRFVFLGKAAVYSAGATFMSFFAKPNRYLTRGTRLMIHERKLDKKLHINGPLTSSAATVKALLHEIETSVQIQNEGFANLVRGSRVSLEDVLSRASCNWYVEAEEAKKLGLVHAVL